MYYRRKKRKPTKEMLAKRRQKKEEARLKDDVRELRKVRCRYLALVKKRYQRCRERITEHRRVFRRKLFLPENLYNEISVVSHIIGIPPRPLICMVAYWAQCTGLADKQIALRVAHAEMLSLEASNKKHMVEIPRSISEWFNEACELLGRAEGHRWAMMRACWEAWKGEMPIFAGILVKPRTMFRIVQDD